jgi:hypothetical protein
MVDEKNQGRARLPTKITINDKSGLAYISEKIRGEGYKGEVECLPNAITLTLIRPGSSLEDVKRSLRHALQDIDLRMKYHETEEG